MANNIVQELLRERDRVRDVVVPEYESIGQAGKPALLLTIGPSLRAAEAALASGSVVDIVRALQDLRGIK